MLNRDYAEMLQCLMKHGVEYLVVGAYALAGHGLPRSTGDIDIWVRPDPTNAAKVYRALADFGAPLDQVAVETFTLRRIPELRGQFTFSLCHALGQT
jgi:hypothetical protein